ncbi:pheromone processing endoprotease [Entomophthora muscae]|uniref:Pheromone processing endoprotease n=1 Tax=Entomophthora muscae TaxID=34485 RepID=A0ACC2RVP8_9FUNG|nr:pheromone processing endoprotease [Entomophthora muscae]
MERSIVAAGLRCPASFFTDEKSNPKGNGHDLTVTGLGINGTGVTVATLDLGANYTIWDIKDNYFMEGSYNFLQQKRDAMALNSNERHGTRIAGLIVVNHTSKCSAGIAYGENFSSTIYVQTILIK